MPSIAWAAGQAQDATLHQAKVCPAQLPFEGPGAAAALAALGHGEAVLLTPYNRFPYFMLRPLPGRGPTTQLPSRELQAVLGAHALPAAAACDADTLDLTLGSTDYAGPQPMQAAAGHSSCAGAAAQQAPARSVAAGLAAAPRQADDSALLSLAGDDAAAMAAAVHPEGAGPSATFASYFRCGLPVLNIFLN